MGIWIRNTAFYIAYLRLAEWDTKEICGFAIYWNTSEICGFAFAEWVQEFADLQFSDYQEFNCVSIFGMEYLQITCMTSEATITAGI
jgi:hypothetical protein